MNYESSIEYKNDPVVSIDTICVVCESCSALKMNLKACFYLKGKIKVKEIIPPPELLHSLLTGSIKDQYTDKDILLCSHCARSGGAVHFPIEFLNSLQPFVLISIDFKSMVSYYIITEP